MSTENTQTDVTPSDVGAESVSVTPGSETTTTTQTAATPTLDGLKKMAKDGETFKPKTIEESAAEETKPQTPPPSAFTPNYKYKAALQEKEIEEFWRPLIKDADSENKVKDFLSKLDGFEYVKSSRDKLQQQFESLTSDYQSQSQVVQRVEGALERGDLTSAFRQLGLKDEDIYKWTQQKLQMLELPPDQRRALEDAEQNRLQSFDLEEQKSQMQRMYEEQAVQVRTMQLEMVLSRPEVSTAAQSWDSLTGELGAFRDLIIQEAQNAFYQSGIDLTAEQATQRVMQRFGKVMNQGVSQAQPQAVPPVQTYAAPNQPVVPQAKPIIPNVNGKGAAPIKKVPKSLDDLRKLAKEMQA